MKIFSSEVGHNYGTYTFGYANYCLLEKGDKLSNIYELGYLPYSGSPDVKNVFYMARSARMPLGSFNFSSENRRIAKKFDGRFERTSYSFDKFNYNDPVFINFCVEYFTKRHGPDVMPVQRLKSILRPDLVTHIVSYQNESASIAYVFEVSDKAMTHFWFSFYDLSLVHQSLGMWLMLDSARQAKNRGAKYFYLGTVYSQKALYKMAFKNIEYWDGQKWQADNKRIKQLGRQDGDRQIGLTDLWKKNLKLF